MPLDTNPFHSWATVIDCGDIPVTSYDNTYALQQIENGHYSILSRTPATAANKKGPAKNGRTLPRVITLGGDHTITLPLLRSINRAYGPVSVIHFDSHLDTCTRTRRRRVLQRASANTRETRASQGLRRLAVRGSQREPRYLLLPRVTGGTPRQRLQHPRRHPHDAERPQ